MGDREPWELLAERLITEKPTSADRHGRTIVIVKDGASKASGSSERSPVGSPSGVRHEADSCDKGSESFEEADGARLRSKAKRVSVNEVDADRIGTAGERGTHRVFENEPGKKQLPDGVAADFVAVSVSEFEERVGLMFKESSSGPTHSGRKPMASKVNKRIMKMAWEMMDDHDVVPACLIAVLSSAFGNFDRMVGCGWLLADAIGLPMIERSDAYAVGLKARTQVGKLKTKIYEKTKAPPAAARKLADSDPKRKDLLDEASRIEQALLDESIELPFSRVSQDAKASSSATGSRKRALEPAVTPQQRRMDEAVAGCAEAQKALRSAQRAQEDAEKTYTTKGKVLDKWLERINTCRPQSVKKFEPGWESATVAYEQAKEASSEADQDALFACIEVLQAENELLRCEKAGLDALVQEMRAT